MNKRISIKAGNTAKTVKTVLCGLLAVSLMALAGCASAPIKTATTFFPPAPEEPKLQFLKAISGSKDIEVAETGISKSLMTFATGEQGETKPIVKPYGLRFFNGKLYVCDLQGFSVVIIDFANNTYTTFSGKGSGKLKKPLNVAVDKDGSMFVVDAGRHDVLRFAPNGDYAGLIGLSEGDAKDAGKDGKDGKDGKPVKPAVMKPADVAVDTDNVYVLDMNGNDIKVFDKASGKHLRNIGAYVEGQPGGLALPSNMSMKNGLLHVTNVASGNVVVMDTNGKLISQFGKIGDGFGDFARPKGISVGAEGRVWVADGGFGNVQIFNNAEKHRLLIAFGDGGMPNVSLSLPVGIALTDDAASLGYWQKFAAPGFILEEIAFVGNQGGNTKVSVYGLGHRLGKDGKAPEAVTEAPEKTEAKVGK